MAIVVESSSTTAWASTASLSVTKPSGLAVGDVLIAIIGLISDTMATPTGWTHGGTIAQGGSVGAMDLYTFYKIADASDVAASSFSFPPANPSKTMAGCLLRASGVRHDAPLQTLVQASANGDNPTFTLSSTTPNQNGSLLVAAFAGRIAGGEFDANLTLNGTNPTWTERMDAYGAANSVTMDVFTGIQATAAAITSLSVGASNDGGTTDWEAGILIFGPRTDAAGTVALLSGSPTIFTPVGSSGTNGTAALLVNSAHTIFTPSARSENPTWTDLQMGSSSTWTDQTL